ncbi:MAG TPA: hypothetical protein VI916_08470 [Acidimicrobiia bacterium]|nr:hypothetical protein [Acidimicrobiia bacterium]
MRRTLARALAIGAAAALAAVQGALWVQGDLLDSERFAAAATDSLQSAEVRALIADAITERVVARSPVAVPDDASARIAEEVARAATERPFAEAFEAAVAALHRSLLSGDADQVILDLAAAEPAVRAAVARADPALAERLPVDDLRAVNVGAEEQLPDLSRLSDETGRSLRLSLLLAGIGLTLGLLVADNRYRVVVAAGIALAFWSTLLALGPNVFVDRFAERLVDPALENAARALVREMTEGLRLRAWATVALGLTSAAVAWTRGRGRTG